MPVENSSKDVIEIPGNALWMKNDDRFCRLAVAETLEAKC